VIDGCDCSQGCDRSIPNESRENGLFLAVSAVNSLATIRFFS
jgi:hypothetical protein